VSCMKLRIAKIHKYIVKHIAKHARRVLWGQGFIFGALVPVKKSGLTHKLPWYIPVQPQSGLIHQLIVGSEGANE
jgi:hypothetical protein